MSLVEVQNLTRRFGPVVAVQDISFRFDQGDIFGFIGPNGAGKSTAMRILATLDLPSEGHCTVGGYSTVDDADAVRRLIGYMPDNYGTYPNMTVREYLDFFARAYDLHGPARQRAIADIVDFCNLAGLVEKHITTLSKGMKQRLCLGRCLINDPQLLILDEPSAGLDPRARIEFRDLLRLLAKQGKSIFISSHILSELDELCDGVAVIEQGRMVASGRIDDILAGRSHDQVAALEAAGQDPVEDSSPAAGPGVQLELQLSVEHDRLEALLAEQPELDQLHIDGRNATARCRCDAAGRHRLLQRLLDAGLPVCHFAARDRRLEDLFMRITEGRVQ